MTPETSWAVVLGAALMLSGCPDPASRGDERAGNHFAAPQGIAAHSRWVLVSNTGYHLDEAGQQAYSPGFVTIIDRQTRQVAATVPTTQKNPQRVAVVGDRAYVLNAGVVKLGQGGPAAVVEGGGIDVLDLAGATAPQKVLRNIALPTSSADERIGAYGSLAVTPDGKTAFIGSGTRGDVFVVNLETGALVHGPEAPLALFPTPPDRNDLTTVRWIGEELAVLSFAQDTLCLSADITGGLAKRRCYPVGVDGQQIEGPIDIVEGDQGRLLVAMSLANRLYRVSLLDTTGGTSAPQAKVDPSFADAGSRDPLAPNRVLRHGPHAYLLASTSEQLLRVALPGGKTEPTFALFPPGSNPFDFAITGAETSAPHGLAWVTLFGSHQVAIVDLRSGEVLQTLAASGAEPDAGASSDAGVPDITPPPDAGCPDGPALVTIESIEKVTYGAGAGHGQSDLPAVIRGGPQGLGRSGGSSGVLSLGEGGEIVVGFGDHDIVDGPGPDFIVFENPFAMGPYQSYAEPAVVAVGERVDGSFQEFPCDLAVTSGDPSSTSWAYPGCAGVRPVLANVADNCITPLDPSLAGGDAFDLADLGLKRARLVRIRDAGISKLGVDSRGFDLDAIVVIHHAPRRSN